MKKYEIILKNNDGNKKKVLVETLTFPEAASIAYKHRAESRFEYEIVSVSRVDS